MSQGIIKIAIANYSYLGTIASPIKERLSQSGFKCEFVERSQEEIQEILDLASEERFISGEFRYQLMDLNDIKENLYSTLILKSPSLKDLWDIENKRLIAFYFNFSKGLIT